MTRYEVGSWRRFLTLAGLLFLIPAVSIQGQGGQGRAVGRETINGHDAVAGEVLVSFRGPDDQAERGALANQLDLDVDEGLGNGAVHRLRSRNFDTQALLAFFRSYPNIDYAEPNYILNAVAVPNDPMVPQLWGLRNPTTPNADIHATAAWDISTGVRNAVVAVVDTGIDYNHPDLAANVWSAPTSFTVTIGTTSITCAAGTHGFNAIKKTCDPLDDNAHGTHVSGTIGALGNNGVGVVGVNWATRIMGAKFLSARGSGSTSDAINAIEFTIQAKSIFGSAANVRVLSNSWGGGGYSQALLDEINKAGTNDMLFVAAAGNNGSNNDSTPSYPASYNANNIIAVAATDSVDGLASFSNYGATTVDLGAPGVGILSTTPNNTYSTYSGTSMATPHVSGAAMLVLSACSLNTTALKTNLLANVDLISSLAGRTVTGGRLNVDRSIRACASVAPAAPTLQSAIGGDAQTALQWSSVANATGFHIKRRTLVDTQTTIATVGTVTNFTDTTAVNGTTYYYVVSALNGALEGDNSNELSATPSAPLSPPAAPATISATAGDRQVALAWGAASGATSYNVKRGTASGAEVTVGSTSTTSYADVNLTNGITYYYMVTAQNSAGEGLPSQEASAMPTAPTIDPPNTPTGLQATAGPGAKKVTLSWNAAGGASTYNVLRSVNSCTAFSTIATGVATTSVTNTGLASGTPYCYEVVAVGTTGLLSPPSAPSELVTPR